MSQKVLLIQSRPEQEAADNEYDSICRLGSIDQHRMQRFAMNAAKLTDIDTSDYCAIIMGGGPANFALPMSQKSDSQKRYEPWLINLLQEIIRQDKPFLGLCLGVGGLAAALGAQPDFAFSESPAPVKITLSAAAKEDPLLKGVSDSFIALAGHKEGIGKVPPGCVELARSEKCVHMYRIGQNVYATQFHPELDYEGFAIRINTYKHHGYFKPEEGEAIIASAAGLDYTDAAKILKNFANRYIN